jgi:Spy/CpxP family protein refolding chaperone
MFILIAVVLVVAASVIAGERKSEERGELGGYLQLSPSQRTAWDSAKADFESSTETLFQKRHALMEQVEAALKSKSSDACGIGSNMVAAQAIGDQIRAAKETLIQKRVSVLTPEQKTKYDAFVAARGEGEMKLRHP